MSLKPPKKSDLGKSWMKNNPKQKKNRCTGNPSGFIGSGKGTLLDGRLADP